MVQHHREGGRRGGVHRISVHHEQRQRRRSIECGEWVSHVLYFHGSIYLRELFASMHASAMAGKRLNCTYEIRRRRRRRTEKIIREREGEEFDIHSVGSASAHRAAISPLHMEWLHKRIYSQKNTNHDLLANIPLGWHR